MTLQDRLRHARKSDFFGREAQLDLFKRNLAGRIPEYPLLQIVGQGGVGKTTLLRRYRELCDEMGAVQAMTDEIEKSAPAAMHRLAELLSKAGYPLKTFEERYQTYLQLQEKIDKEPDRPDMFSQLFSGTAKVKTSGVVRRRSAQGYHLGKIRKLLTQGFSPEELRRFCYDEPEFRPVCEALAGNSGKDEIIDRLLAWAEQKLLLDKVLRFAQDTNPARYREDELIFEEADPGEMALAGMESDSKSGLSSYLWQKLKNKDEVELLLEPEAGLSPLFWRDLNEVAQQRQVVLMFDTFEETGAVLLAWLLRVVEGGYGEVSERVSFVLAGRSFEAQAWLPLQPLLQCCSLEPFSEEETQRYLEAHGVTEREDIDQIYRLSGGLPVLVGTLATPGSAHTGQVYRGVVERFLRNIDDTLRRQAALQVALARRFDRDVLAALLPAETEGAVEEELFNWLIGLPFVQARPGYWVYHPVVRKLMVAYQRDQSRREFERLHQRLADYYGQQAEKWGSQGADKWQNGSWWPYYGEFTYHRLCAEPQGNLATVKVEGAELIAQFNEVVFGWVEAIKQAGTDLGEHETINQWAMLVEHGVAAIEGNKMGEALELFERLCDLPTLANTPPVKARLYFGRALCYDRLNRPEAAIKDYSEAIRLNPQDATAYNNRGLTYYALKQYEAALADYGRAIELNPQDATAYNNRGLTYADLKQTEAALADYGRAIELNPHYATAYNNRGNTYYALKQTEAALADYGRAIELNPQDATAYNNRGNTYADLKQTEAALADYGRAIELNPHYATAYNNRGNTYYALKQYEAALADYGRAIELNPHYATAYNNRGNTYADLKQYEAALADYGRAIELNPQDATAFYNRGLTYADLKQTEAALADYGRAIELNPHYATAYNNRGNTYYALKQYEAALADYGRAIELNPHYATAYNNRGNTYADLKQYEAALADYGRAIELNPQDATAFYNRGLTYKNLKQTEAALADYGRAIELNPQDATAFYNRGNTYKNLKQTEAALADYGRAIELNPHYATAYNNRGLTYADLKQYEAALADYGRAIELNPQDATAYNNRGLTYKNLKQTEAALADYGRAIELNPHYATAFYNRGNTYADLKQTEAALADYGRAIELNPHYATAYNNRGNTYADLKQTEAALADYGRAIELNPQDATAFYNTACAYALQGQVEEALPALRRALELEASRYLDLIPTDSDFDLIREEPGFKALLAEFAPKE